MTRKVNKEALRFELRLLGTQPRVLTILALYFQIVTPGIEPGLPIHQKGVIPLHYATIKFPYRDLNSSQLGESQSS